jgi:hypothetical protein
MPEISSADWLTMLRRNCALCCITGAAPGYPGAKAVLETIVTGAVAGAVTKISRREAYDIVQSIADDIASVMVDDAETSPEAEKGRSK